MLHADGPLAAPLAIVDLETTGAHPAWDRVTEIAVLEIEDGDVTAEWSTLVNPGMPIPAAIQALTGISNAMVADAPSFAELAQDLYARLAGRVFVAHNARFDYGFLRNEFELVHRAPVAAAVSGTRTPQPRQLDRAARHRMPGAPPGAR